ncbi:MAG: FecR domain-containing protein [Gammaproteobacteria bacterium]|nr:FecR domain-containing protein [Gammaproteobacteria bacterium]
MNTKTVVMLLTVLIAGMAFNTTNAEIKAVGQVAVLKGSAARYTPDGSAQALGRGDRVYEQDRIETGERSLISIRFDDNTRFNLGPKSIFKVNKVVSGDDGIFDTEVIKGAFRFVTGLIAKRRPRAMRVKTGVVATIGIRGTTVGGEVEGDSAVVVLLESKETDGPSAIEVSNVHGKVVITKPGYGTRIPDANSPPSPPQRMRLRAIENLVRNITNIQRIAVPRPRIR